MKKNDIIAFALIALLLLGSSLYPLIKTRIQQKKEMKAAAEYVANAAENMSEADTLVISAPLATPEAEPAVEAAPAVVETPAAVSEPAKAFKDDMLDAASSKPAEFVTLENDKVQIVLTTKGAQPYIVKVKGHSVYRHRKDSTAIVDTNCLRLVREGNMYYDISVFSGEAGDSKNQIRTGNLCFEVADQTDTTVTMRVALSNGGYIQQKYTLASDSYVLKDDLSFVGLQDVIPSKVSNIGVDWAMIVPRLEKGYKNEKQYSNVSYYFEGEKKPEMLAPRRGNYSNKAIRDTKVRWIDFKQQFFSSILTAPKDFVSGEIAVRFSDEKEYLADHNLMRCSAKMVSEIKHSDNIEVPFEFYFGPNDFQGLKKLNAKYEKVIPLGGSLVGWISRFLIIPVFHFLNRFISNYGLIILIMTILLKIVISPLTLKSYRSSAVTQVLKPEIDKLNQKYPKQEDAMKKQQAQMELYKKAGVSPLGGCLPMLLQFPILWAMFRFFPASIELRQQHFLWAEDLSAYDSILNIGNWHLSLFALLMAITMFFYSKMNSSTMSDDPQMAPMKFMTIWMMPVMMFFICNGLSSALSYYYLLSNCFTMLQTWVIKKWFVDNEKILAKVHAKTSAPVKKSKWQMRLEEAQRMQAQQMKNRK